MSVAEIQRAVVSIKMLPPEDRIRVYYWAMAEMEPEAMYAVFDHSFARGQYNAIMAETDNDYREGRTLSKIY
jgi:hypothetical protein